MFKRTVISFTAVAAVLAFGCSSSEPEAAKPKTTTDAGSGGASPGTGGGGPGTGGSGVTGGSSVVDDSGAGGSVVVPDGTAPAGDKCWGRTVVAAGTAGLVDDFEDGDLTVAATETRVGEWTLNAGTGCTVTPSPLVSAAPVAAGGKNTTAKALGVNIAACTSYASMSASLNKYVDTTATPVGDAGPPWYTCAYDVSKYDGVYFWGVGDGVEVTVQLPTRSTIPLGLGGDGSCETGEGGEGCWSHFLMTFTMTNEWAQYFFPWSDLLQGLWGTQTTFKPSLVTGVNFGVDSKTNTFPADVWIDNVGFYKGSPPAGP